MILEEFYGISSQVNEPYNIESNVIYTIYAISDPLGLLNDKLVIQGYYLGDVE